MFVVAESNIEMKHHALIKSNLFKKEMHLLPACCAL